MAFCHSNGHAVRAGGGRRACPLHRVVVLNHCAQCHARWPAINTGAERAGADFCGRCAFPAPWAPREARLEWIAEQALDEQRDMGARIALRQLFATVQVAAANDSRMARAWQEVRRLAPRAWAASRTLQAGLIGEAVLRAVETAV